MILQNSIFPPQASELAFHVDFLFWTITIVSVVTSLGVYGAMLLFCIIYRRKDPTKHNPTPRILGSHQLELLWSVVPMIIFLVFFGWGAWIYQRAVEVPQGIPELMISGKQWMWKIQYPGGQRVILAQNSLDYMNDIGGKAYFDGTMVMPKGKAFKITTISEDVIHDFGIPAFRQKIDVVPGRYTSTWYQPNQLGEFYVFCDQYCGLNHSLMVGKVRVVEPADYEAWLEGRWREGEGKNAIDGSPGHQGRQLFFKLNCINCHNKEAPRAPELGGLYRASRGIKGGTTVVADDNYIRESIRNPRDKVREGWEPIMPHYGKDKVSEEDIYKVIAYIKSLKPGELPSRTDNWVAPVGAPTEAPAAAGSTKE
jgi:cytochrome c oxidase subunit II